DKTFAMPFPDKGTNTLRIDVRILGKNTKQSACGILMPTRLKTLLRDPQSAVRMSLAKFRKRARQLHRSTIAAQPTAASSTICIVRDLVDHLEHVIVRGIAHLLRGHR